MVFGSVSADFEHTVDTSAATSETTVSQSADTEPQTVDQPSHAADVPVDAVATDQVPVNDHSPIPDDLADSSWVDALACGLTADAQVAKIATSPEDAASDSVDQVEEIDEDEAAASALEAQLEAALLAAIAHATGSG